MERTKGTTTMRVHLALAALVASAAFATGCSGGGGGSAPSTPAAPAATATPTPAADALQLFLATQAETDGSPISSPQPGVLGANNLSLSYTAVGAQQGIIVYEPGFTGTFSAPVRSCTLTPAAVTVTPASFSGAPLALFVITVASAGDCVIKITDGTTFAPVLVDVTTTTGSISATQRK
jgi:hypothetical protein